MAPAASLVLGGAGCSRSHSWSKLPLADSPSGGLATRHDPGRQTGFEVQQTSTRLASERQVLTAAVIRSPRVTVRTQSGAVAPAHCASDRISVNRASEPHDIQRATRQHLSPFAAAAGSETLSTEGEPPVRNLAPGAPPRRSRLRRSWRTRNSAAPHLSSTDKSQTRTAKRHRPISPKIRSSIPSDGSSPT
jgi:hypothetical protein